MKYAYLLLPLALLACGKTEPRFDAPPVAAFEKVSTRYARIEVAAVTLPVYAQGEEIHTRNASGAILPLGPLWADEPSRAVTLQVARDLDAITGRLVAPEPWPFRDYPDVKVDVRVQDFYATERGTFRIAGQVFVAPEEGGPDRAKTFEIETAIPGEKPGPAQIAAARSAAVSELSVFIAKNGLR
ncbi:PqiC family protein [Sagittula sp. S175]|uniref:PqiC family protein n=1 Tax=Sagittula sp. S175 TaxID=3415129 RepID=UPI003C7DC575